MRWGLGSGYTAAIFQVGRMWCFQNTERLYLYMGVFGTAMTVR
jgi:hypothetical protein